MKHEIIDIKDISDSKEVYGQRPNPFFAGFIYSLTAILIAVFIYCGIGKIEIVARAQGIVRPNEDVSTVTNNVSGKLIRVNAEDGMAVQPGDVLFEIDTAEAQISLEDLLRQKAEYEEERGFVNRFIEGITDNENPFSSDSGSDEYRYYVLYENYALNTESSELSILYDMDKTKEVLKSSEDKINLLKTELAGLNDYRESVVGGKDCLSDGSLYKSSYLLYEADLKSLKEEYTAQKKKIEHDTTQQSNDFYRSFYESQIEGYKYLAESIEKGDSVFPVSYKGNCLLLYKDFVAQLDEYQRQESIAKNTYSYYKDGGGTGSADSSYLAYDKSMLEGYKLYKKSVEQGQDCFDSSKNSVFYRSLYAKYQAEYDTLSVAVNAAQTAYIPLSEDPLADPSDIATALETLDAAMVARDDYKAETLAEIDNAILKINETIAEKELSLNEDTIEFNKDKAKLDLESAEAAVDAYVNKMLTEYRQTILDFETKLAELDISDVSLQNKDEMMAALDASYAATKESHHYQTLSQIDSNIVSLKTELSAIESEFALYQLTDEMNRRSIAEDGEPLSVKIGTMEKLSSLLSDREILDDKIDEINTRILQTEEQMSQAVVRAEKAGIVNMVTPLVPGDVLPCGTNVMTIIPPSESEYKVQLYVSNSEIANIDVGDIVKYNIAALPYNQYGILDGYVTSISSDALVMDGQYSGYYQIECSIANTELTDKDGNTGTVGIGMELDAKIVTQEKTILRYLLEKIDLF